MRTLTTRTKSWTMMMIRMNTPFNMIHFRGGGGGTGGAGIDDVIADGLTPPVGHTPLINRQQRSRPALHQPVLQQDQLTSNGIIPGMASCFLIVPRVRHKKLCFTSLKETNYVFRYRPVARIFYGQLRSNEETDRTRPERGRRFETAFWAFWKTGCFSNF